MDRKKGKRGGGRGRERERDSEPQPPFGPSVRSAIHESQQLTSLIGVLSLKLPPLASNDIQWYLLNGI